MKKIRQEYDKYGAEGYYREHSDSYKNPHFPQIKTLIEQNIHRIDAKNALDFCAGGGEVSRVLLDMKIGQVTGCDPFTFDLYQKNIGQNCLQFSFTDIIKGAKLDQYSCIISSFALHLCPKNDLYPLVWNLFQAAPQIIVLTPHKRPELEKLTGVELLWEDFTLTKEKLKKVRMKCYGLKQA